MPSYKVVLEISTTIKLMYEIFSYIKHEMINK